MVLLLMVGFAGAGIPSAAASTRHASQPCGEVTFEYSSARPRPGEAMDMDLIVNNCSHRLEHLRVHARSHGPCPFPNTVDHTYSLPAQSGVGGFALVLVPSCKRPVFRPRQADTCRPASRLGCSERRVCSPPALDHVVTGHPEATRGPPRTLYVIRNCQSGHPASAQHGPLLPRA